ncbi:hypothetical protein JD969_09320 [Planctomycetota bacterium]|nr:hypothetical protein JD969_09320 [Planctomycetota bacterium]
MRGLEMSVVKSWGRLGQLWAVRPMDEEELHLFIKVVLGLDVPREVRSDGNDACFEYVKWAYFEGSTACFDDGNRKCKVGEVCGVRDSGDHGSPTIGVAGDAFNGWLDDTKNNALQVNGGIGSDDVTQQGGDCVVWANRGGGKTMLGAVVTLLDLMFKPGIQVRILGGSLEQSGRMYEHLLALLERPMLKGIVKGEPTQRKIELVNGSRVEILAQSQRSVRGVRVHKLRCDEVEEFDKDVWEAAQLVTRSGWCGDVWVKGRVEALSTMHRPGGLMGKLVSQGWKVFRWNAIDVMQLCDRRCHKGCSLWEDCKGKGQTGHGFIGVDDLMDQWRRTSSGTWDSEMMCKKPRMDEMVYSMFEREKHVKKVLGTRASAVENASEVLERWEDGYRQGGVGEVVRDERADRRSAATGVAEDLSNGGLEIAKYVIGGMDFGIRSLAVVLTGVVHEVGDGKRIVHVVDELMMGGVRLDGVIDKWEVEMSKREIEWPRWMGVDPAGMARNMQTGVSDVTVLKGRGYEVRAQRVRIKEGIELVRRMLDRGELFVHPRCVGLIEAMEGYHFDGKHGGCDEPVKDGPDHACDALRYMLQNLLAGYGKKIEARIY